MPGDKNMTAGDIAATEADIMKALARAANPAGAKNAEEYKRIKEERATKEAEAYMANRRQNNRYSGKTTLASGRTPDEVSPRPGHMSNSRHTTLASQAGSSDNDTTDNVTEQAAPQPGQQAPRIRRTGTTLASGHTPDEVSPRPGHMSSTSRTRLSSAPQDDNVDDVEPQATRPTGPIRRKRRGTVLASGHTPDEVSPRPGHLPGGAAHTNLANTTDESIASTEDEGDGYYYEMPSHQSGLKRTKTVLSSGHSVSEVFSQEGVTPDPDQLLTVDQQIKVAEEGIESVAKEILGESGGDADDAENAQPRRPRTILSSGADPTEAAPIAEQSNREESQTYDDAENVDEEAVSDVEVLPDDDDTEDVEVVEEETVEEVEETEASPEPPKEPEKTKAKPVKLEAGQSFSDMIKASGGAVPGQAELEAAKKSGGKIINNTWSWESDYEVRGKTDKAVFEDGKVAVPDALIDFFGAETREKRVVFLFEGREYPSYLESANGESGYTLSWSRALSRKFVGLFPQYEDFFDGGMTPDKEAARPYFLIEKIDEATFAVRLMFPADEALTRKQQLFDLIGPGKSISHFDDSYGLLFLKAYFENIDNMWRSDVFVVSGDVQKFYQERIKSGKPQDPKAAKTLDNMADAGLDVVLDFLIEGPYKTYSEAGFIQTAQADDHFYFAMDRDLTDELSMDDKNTIVSLLDDKIAYYFDRLDGPGLQETLTEWVNGYADYFNRDFRYSFKDVITETIPATLEGMVDNKRYRVSGFAGTDHWAKVPWVEITDKQITRFPNTDVAVKYLLDKDSRTLYLALTVGTKNVENEIIKEGELDPDDNPKAFEMVVADTLAPEVADIKAVVNPETFDANPDDITVPDDGTAASMIFFRAYTAGVPANAVLESDLQAMLALYDRYYHLMVLKDIKPEPVKTPEPEEPVDDVADIAEDTEAETPESIEENEDVDEVASDDDTDEALDDALDDELDDLDDLDLDDLDDLDFDLDDDDEETSEASEDDVPEEETSEKSEDKTEASPEESTASKEQKTDVDDKQAEEADATETAGAASKLEKAESSESSKETVQSDEKADDDTSDKKITYESSEESVESEEEEEAPSTPFDDAITSAMYAALNGKTKEQEEKEAREKAEKEKAEAEEKKRQAFEKAQAEAAQAVETATSETAESASQTNVQPEAPDTPAEQAAPQVISQQQPQTILTGQPQAANGQVPYAQAAVQVVTTGDGITKKDIIALQKAMLKVQLKAQKNMLEQQRKQQLALERRAEKREQKRLEAENAKKQRNRSDLKTEENLVDAPADVLGLIRQIAHYISCGGFSVSDNDVSDLFLSLKAGSLPIITGGEGVAKTTFVRLFAEAVGANSTNGRFKLIPVRPSWQNADGLLGYNGPDGKFVPGAMLDFVAAATENPDKPYFLCLDEMSVTRVEGYFSEVLSVMNSAHPEGNRVVTAPLLSPEVFGSDEDARKYYGDLTLPDNLFIIGTISNEEARHGVSKRLIERAAIIELAKPDLTLTPPPASLPQPTPLKADFFKKDIFALASVVNHRKTITDMVTLLGVINEILQRADAEIGFRVRDEICFFLYYNAEYGLMSPEAAIDCTIVQKMIPRIVGDADEVESVLTELFKICAGTQDENAIYEPLEEGLGLFPTSARKLSEMAVRASNGGRISYWRLSD